MTNMNGKVCLVTGATDGIGKVSARVLAELGAKVIIVGRNPEKSAIVLAELRSISGNENIDLLMADLAVMQEVRDLAEQVISRYDRIDVLLNNAGGYFTKHEITSDGLEMTFALNHMSYFLLTNKLMELLKYSAPARIVNVSSDAHYGVDMEFENLNGEQEYKAWKAYQKSKLANVLFTYELLKKVPGNITVNCLHPGFVATNFGHNNGGFFGPVLKIAQRISAIDPEEGAKTSIFLCSAPEVKGVSGKYFYKCQPKTSSRESRNMDTGKRLWQISSDIAST
jgi:NAD(P)-dependent dehydrogenase (short-subunit alcohol dehydrogenase family)|tara:strand:- start:1163 stop:2008 length:846 start_codon:yes stop_codon:yes gene_type:complete